MKIIATLVLLFAASAKKLTLRSSFKVDHLSKPSCNKMKCPSAWRPKANHHTLSGTAPEDCCDKTCELFACHGAYRSNEAYWGNVGSSPQVCCDKMCGTEFQCDEGYVLADPTAPGISKEDCCEAKCQLFNCTAPWAPSAAKKDVVSSNAEDCCEKTCAAVNCSISGWTANESKATEIGSTPEECCIPLCGNSDQVKCPLSWAVQDEDAKKTSDGTMEGCCKPQCKAHSCSAGWALNVAKEDTFGETDEDCCLPTCKQFNCSLKDGWAPWPAVENDIGDNSSQCCLPTCQQWTCKASDNWLPYSGSAKKDTVGASNSICCLPARSTYGCSAAKGLMQIPGAEKVGGTTDEECCESQKCEQVRKNMEKLSENEYCNGLEKDQCLRKYSKHESSTEVKDDDGKVVKIVNSSSIVMCSFDEVYNLCRYNVDAAIQGGCTGA